MSKLLTMKAASRRPRSRRGMAVYISVLSTAMIVSTLALSTFAVVRLERKQQVAVTNRVIALAHARSAVELALRQLAANSSWRTTYGNNVETTWQTLGANSTGTISWVLTDVDGSLTNADVELRLKGVGRVGETVQVSSVQLSTGELFDNNIRSNSADYGSGGLLGTGLLGDPGDAAGGELKSNQWWGQYFKPALPPEANGWRISRIDISAKRKNSNLPFSARIYLASASRLPTGPALNSVDVNSSTISTSFGTVPINFSAGGWLNVTDGVCVTLETAQSLAPIELVYDTAVSASNSALLRGNPAWYSSDTDDALEYRAYGYYTTSDEVHPLEGTWVRDQL